MLGVTLKGLAGRKIRAVLTGFAIVLGVAMMSGTFVLTDTINAAFTSIFKESYKNADAVISGKTAFTNDHGPSRSLSRRARRARRERYLDGRRAAARVERRSGLRPAVQPARARLGHVAAWLEPGRDRLAHGEQEALLGR
ncbi:MAG: hypothetical protein E6G32_04535 [Actinobacteria bacterium]|nr:MAG: hypothetical protein E6G32_04535 [Actinomycetota bacterium]